ncbi:MAG: oligosaccharide flippase family protein [Candidatus Competibacter sp.]|nr:oligosaccharide flippase family protein [Candidatus Competibacter sp.]
MAEASEPSDSQQQFKNRLSQNTVVQLAAKLLYMVSRFLLPPVILSHVTLEEYGIWATCFIVIGYLGMGAFGIANVYIRYIAEYAARQDIEAINRLLSTGLTVTTLGGAVLLAALGLSMPALLDLLHIAPHLRETAAVLIFTTAAVIVLDMSLSIFAQVLNGMQLIARQTVIWVASFLLEAALIVGLLVAGFGVYALLWAFVFRYLIGTWLSARACFQALPGLRVGPRRFDRRMLPLFYRFGGVVQVTGMLSMFLYSIEKVIAGLFIGVRATGLFDLGEKLPVMSSQITSALETVILPAITHLHTLGQTEELRKLYLKGSRYISLLGGFIMGFLLGFATPIMTAWLGPAEDLQITAFIMAWFTLPFQIHVTTGPCSAFHRGTGHPQRELFYPFAQMALVVLLVGGAFLVMGTTIPAITIGVATAMVLSGGAYMFYTNRLLGIAARHYLWRVLLPGLAPYAIGLGLAWLARPWLAVAGTERWPLLGVLTVCGTLYAVIAGALLYWALCDWGEREYLRRQLQHTLSGLLGKATKGAPS